MGLVNLTEWVNLDRLVPVECLRIKALQRVSVTASMQREVNHWAEGILWTGSHACLCVPALPFTYEAITLGSSAFEVEAKSGFEVTWCTWREHLNGNLGSTEQAACAECLVSVLVISAKLRKELKVLMSLDVSIYLFLSPQMRCGNSCSGAGSHSCHPFVPVCTRSDWSRNLAEQKVNPRISYREKKRGGINYFA